MRGKEGSDPPAAIAGAVVPAISPLNVHEPHETLHGPPSLPAGFTSKEWRRGASGPHECRLEATPNASAVLTPGGSMRSDPTPVLIEDPCVTSAKAP